LGPFAQLELGQHIVCYRDLVEVAINAAVPPAGEREFGQRTQVFGEKPDLLTQLPPQRLLRSFVPIDRAAK